MKGTYLLYTSADSRMDEIYEYTVSQWGEAQAARYIEGLHAHFQMLANKELSWRKLSKKAPASAGWMEGIYLSHYYKHLIFFKVFDQKTIGIMSVLHEAMDISVRLFDDLQR
jgi:toxin ParE1/3/4